MAPLASGEKMFRCANWRNSSEETLANVPYEKSAMWAKVGSKSGSAEMSHC